MILLMIVLLAKKITYLSLNIENPTNGLSLSFIAFFRGKQTNLPVIKKNMSASFTLVNTRSSAVGESRETGRKNVK